MTGWVKIAAQFNPIIYGLEARQALLNTGWEGEALLRGLLGSTALFLVTFGFAFSVCQVEPNGVSVNFANLKN